jgi:hypothetical protein
MTTLLITSILWITCGVFTIALDKFISISTNTSALKYPAEYGIAFAFGPISLVMFIAYLLYELICNVQWVSKHPNTLALICFTIIALICLLIYNTWII